MRPLLVYLPTSVRLNGLSGPILDWYGHCVHVSVNKLGGVWGHGGGEGIGALREERKEGGEKTD